MREWLWHAQHEVGLADLASFGKIGQPRVVGGVTLWHPLFDPGADQRLLVFAQKPLSSKGTVVVVRGPRRHVVGLRHVFNEGAKRRHLLVGRERHGPDFALTMTLRALGVNQWGDVFVKRDRLRRSVRSENECQQGESARLNSDHGRKLPILPVTFNLCCVPSVSTSKPKIMRLTFFMTTGDKLSMTLPT